MKRKRLTQECFSIDIQRWAREGKLIPSSQFEWHWKTSEKQVQIEVYVGRSALVLQYQVQRQGVIELKKQLVRYAWSTGHLNGRRRWFQCPDCHRRAARLYFTGGRFRCRHCGALGYRSQYLGHGRTYSSQHRMCSNT